MSACQESVVTLPDFICASHNLENAIVNFILKICIFISQFLYCVFPAPARETAVLLTCVSERPGVSIGISELSLTGKLFFISLVTHK